jgi:hypothetical protein
MKRRDDRNRRSVRPGIGCEGLMESALTRQESLHHGQVQRESLTTHEPGAGGGRYT